MGIRSSGGGGSQVFGLKSNAGFEYFVRITCQFCGVIFGRSVRFGRPSKIFLIIAKKKADKKTSLFKCGF